MFFYSWDRFICNFWSLCPHIDSRLISKSDELADRARSREGSQSRLSFDAGSDPDRSGLSRRSSSHRARFSVDSKAPTETAELHESPDAKRSRPDSRQNISSLSTQESFQSTYVFDRLAARSREYALRMRSQSNERQQVSPI